MKNSTLKMIMYSLISLSLIVSNSSCKKVKDAQTAANNAQNADPQSGKDYILASSTFSDVFKKVNDAAQYKHLLKSLNADSCPKITVTGNYPAKAVTILFDTINGCTSESVTYKGSIIESMSGPLETSGTVINISFKNFYVNGNKVEGQCVLTNTGRDANNYLVFRFEVKNGAVTTSSGKTIFNTTLIWTWTQGESTIWPNTGDDVYTIAGSGDGTNINGKHYTVTIATPVTIMMSCQWKLVSGQVTVTPDSGTAMTLDYGSGTCDSQVLIKVTGLPDVTVNM